MRTTVHLDDDLLERLRERAQTERTSLTRCINYLLRKALESSLPERPKRRFRQETFRMGVPAFDLNKALSTALELEDQEVLHKLALRK